MRGAVGAAAAVAPGAAVLSSETAADSDSVLFEASALDALLFCSCY